MLYTTSFHDLIVLVNLLAAFSAIKAQIEASRGMIKSVFLVGGYAASPWLFGHVAPFYCHCHLLTPQYNFRQLQERLAPYGVAVSRPDTQTCVYPCFLPNFSHSTIFLSRCPSSDRKRLRTVPLDFTAIIMFQLACPSLCTVLNF